ncbi:hypothetical protein Tco_1286228 [Tanacetum coccineum]
MGGSYYPIPCSILSTGKDRITLQRYPDVPTTSWRISIRSIDSFQGLTLKSPSPQPQALDTTFEARVWDYMATHTERMERFENTIFKQCEEINGRMTEMFRLLKELTTSRTHEKVLIREEAKFPVTKNVKSISLIKGEEGGSDRMKVTPDNAEKLTETEMEMPVMEVEKINKVENRVRNKSIKTSESEEAVETPGSQPIAYYLKHKINEKLIKGLVNNKFNNSRSRTQARKKKGKGYKVLPGGPAYDAILKKKITKKEDIVFDPKVSTLTGFLKFSSYIIRLSHSFWTSAKFSMASHTSSPLNSLRFPSAAKSRFILMLLEQQGISFEWEGCVLWGVLKECGWWSFIHHGGERKSDLQNKGHKEKIEYEKANVRALKSYLKGLLHKKFYNSLGSAPNRYSIVWARLGVVYRSLEE